MIISKQALCERLQAFKHLQLGNKAEIVRKPCNNQTTANALKKKKLENKKIVPLLEVHFIFVKRGDEKLGIFP